MLKIYDSNHNFLTLLSDGLRNVYTTETVEVGTKNLCFQVPCDKSYLQYISEENYVETADYEYVIKELVLEDNDFFTVYCNANIEEITGFVFPIFDIYLLNPEQAYQYCVSQLPMWSVEYHSNDHTVLTIQTLNLSAMEGLRAVQEETNQELWFDAKNKIIHIYNKIGSISSTSYYSNEIRLRRLSKQSSTYDYATVLYPYGKDGLDIKQINNGKPYLENYSYTQKRIEKVWVNEDIDVAERLKGAAQDYLDSIAQPQASYKVSLCELNPNTNLGDIITLIDSIKRIKQKMRVVKITRYPFASEKDEVELASRQENFARTFIKEKRVKDKELKYIRSVLKDMGARIDALS